MRMIMTIIIRKKREIELNFKYHLYMLGMQTRSCFVRSFTLVKLDLLKIIEVQFEL